MASTIQKSACSASKSSWSKSATQSPCAIASAVFEEAEIVPVPLPIGYTYACVGLGVPGKQEPYGGVGRRIVRDAKLQWG